MARWYNKNSKAIGDGNDVRNCARGFSEASRSMLEARPKAARFERGDDGSAWESDAAEDLRQKMEELPELMRRFAAANGSVAEALENFAPKLDDYQRGHHRLQSEGHRAEREIDYAEQARRRRLQEISGDDNILEKGWNFISGEYGDDHEVRSLNAQIDRLEDEIRRLRAQFYHERGEFKDVVKYAEDLVRSADEVLYNNGWDKVWTQTIEPALEIVRFVLTVAAIVLALAALVGSGGTLAPLIIAGLLVATSATKIIGTAAAGREVTTDMWVDLAIDLAAFGLAGAAHGFSGLAGASEGAKATKFLNYSWRAGKAADAMGVGFFIADQVEDPGGPLTTEESSAEGFSIDIDTDAFEVEIDAIGDEITDDISGALDGLDDLDVPIFEDLGGNAGEKPSWPGVDAKQTGGRS